MKKVALFFILLFLLTGCNLIKPVDNQSKQNQKQNQIIGGQTDEYGCLKPAGYGYDDEIGACIRSWEIKDENLRQAGKVAADYIGKSTGLTIVEILTSECQNCFTVVLEKGENFPKDRITVNVINGKINTTDNATDPNQIPNDLDNTKTEIAKLLAEKYQKELALVQIYNIEQQGNYFRGGVKFAKPGEGGEGGIFFARKTNNKYELVHDGNGGFVCKLLADKGFPISMREGCFVNSEIINGCIDQAGNWLTEYNECENIDRNWCDDNGGFFDECTSACRHQSDDVICTMQCVPVCQF